MSHRAEAKKVVRCAVYTRKSGEEGLALEFNSLDAQREAAEAFVASQRAEGWVCLKERYDDGGFSGGNMDRPALARLLKDLDAGRVDCVVVYKVDRLSRSLLDFARIMETFDKGGVSFVSVTQQFNTTHSMGRLPAGRVPRVSKLMALAIRFDGLLRDGVVADLSELAQLARVTQPRMTQIRNLNHLAPDIQEALLFLPAVASGRDAITERALRVATSEVNWAEQRELWHRIENLRFGVCVRRRSRREDANIRNGDDGDEFLPAGSRLVQAARLRDFAVGRTLSHRGRTAVRHRSTPAGSDRGVSTSHGAGG